MSTTTVGRNAGPSWGFRFLRRADQLLPWLVFRPMLALGSLVAFLAMKEERRAAAAYQRSLSDRKASSFQVWRQFFAFTESLMELIRLSRHGKHVFRLPDTIESREFEELAKSGRAVLFGTFHVGNSDLLGYALHDFGHPVHMVRMRMANSDETTWLDERFGGGVSFLWVDRPDSMLFAIKEAVEAGHSLALKCDRIGQSRRCEAFDFCGKKRIFPFSIYHFSILFEMPVVFATAWKVKKGVSSVIASPIFKPDLKADKVANLERARQHFQAVLDQLEQELQQAPHFWFNFEELNPEALSGEFPYEKMNDSQRLRSLHSKKRS